MKTKIYIVVILLLCSAVAGGIYINQKAIDTAYNSAITMIRKGSYESALSEFEKANPNILDRDDFRSDMKYKNIDECYKNSIPLYSYAFAQFEYNAENRHMSVVNEYLKLIPADYNGELCDEIQTFKENFKPQYEEYLKEQERLAEEAKIERKKREQKYIESLKYKIPYEGMSESYINSTAAGKADKNDSKYIKGTKYSDGYNKDKYFWYADNNNDIVLIVECKDGVVTGVTKYYENVYWTANGMPKFWATKPKTSTSTKKNYSSKKKDPYNVNDYSDPEDFYDDNYDDFWDYEDAEDYYMEHHD